MVEVSCECRSRRPVTKVAIPIENETNIERHVYKHACYFCMLQRHRPAFISEISISQFRGVFDNLDLK